MICKALLLTLCFFVCAKCQVRLGDHFASCRTNVSSFDDCMKDALNDLRPYFKTGIPEFNIGPFDPFFAAEVAQKRSGPFFNYRLFLRNVSESGWSVSQITKLKSDLGKNYIQYTQYFPDKKLDGWYEIDGTFFGQKVTNRGSWNLGLYDYIQTTTVTRRPTRDARGQWMASPPIKAKMNVDSCGKLELHIGNLAGGRTIVENMLDWVINTAWQPGFVVLKPVINDLVSTAFTDIFNKNFQYFPFEQIFQKP